MGESGFDRFPAYLRSGLLAPARTPETVIDKLNGAINGGLRAPEMQASIAKLGTIPAAGPREGIKFRRVVRYRRAGRYGPRLAILSRRLAFQDAVKGGASRRQRIFPGEDILGSALSPSGSSVRVMTYA